jgi:hypothetical protein
MITISKPRIVHESHHARLEADVSVGGKSTTLFFRVEQEYASYLCEERSDAFLAALLFHALDHGHDLRFEGALSARLFYQVESTLIDFLISIYPERKMRRIRMDAPLNERILTTANAKGTGISCGIDSLAAVARQGGAKYGPAGLTHLCFFNTGSHGENGTPVEQQLFEDRRARSIAFSKEAGYTFVEVVSNLSEILDSNFGLTHTYRNISAVLALQKLFSAYYYASAYIAPSFLEHTDDPAYFEILLLPMLSTQNTSFYSSETTVGRYEKTRLVAEYPLSRKYLNVCNVQNINCGRCNKCIRTLLALDTLGKLDDFAEVFDIAEYRAQRSKHLATHYRRYMEGEHSHVELHPHLIEQLGIREQMAGLLGHLLIQSRIRLRKFRILHRVLKPIYHAVKV